MEETRTSDDSCFVPVAGLARVYEPKCRSNPNSRKHPCPDCHFCQECSDARCNACRSVKSQGGRSTRGKLSLREQIRLFDEINAKC